MQWKHLALMWEDSVHHFLHEIIGLLNQEKKCFFSFSQDNVTSFYMIRTVSWCAERKRFKESNGPTWGSGTVAGFVQCGPPTCQQAASDRSVTDGGERVAEEERGHRERERGREVCGREERGDVISIDSQAEHTFASRYGCYHWGDRKEVGGLFALNFNSIRRKASRSGLRGIQSRKSWLLFKTKIKALCLSPHVR